MIPQEIEKWIEDKETDLMHQESHLEAMPEGWSRKVVEHYGGEGEGELYYTVYRFDNGNLSLYVRFNGWYQSYEGSEYDSHEEVVPVQETVTVFKPVK